MIVRFNERTLAAMGFDQASIATLRHLLRQTGGQLGATTLPELADGAGQDTQAAELHAAFAELRKELKALRVVFEAGADAAERAELRKRLRDLDIERAFPPPQTDWEHPGKLGDKTPNAVTSSTLTANSAVKLSPSNQLVDVSPTGTGTVRVNPTTTGTVDNVTLGATTPRAATVTTLTSTVATGTPPLTVASTTEVPNLYAARAASADTAAGLSSPHTFPADATDLPTVITLANALKAAAVAKGL